MKRIVAALLLSATVATAATVTNFITDSGGMPMNTWVVFYPTNTPQIIGITNVLTVPVQARSVRGAWSKTIVGGIYAVDQGQGDLELILVPPNDTATYSFAQVCALASNALTTFSWTNAFPTISHYVWPGVNVTFSTNMAGTANEALIISAAASAYGDIVYSNAADFITPAQLDAAVGTNITLNASNGIRITMSDPSNAWIEATGDIDTTNLTITGSFQTATNTTVFFSNNITAFYPANTDPWYGSFVDFHRPNNTVPQYLRWYNDISTEETIVPAEIAQGNLLPWLGLGTDVASPTATFFAVYDQGAGVDVFNIGMAYSNRTHVSINTVPDPKVTFLVTDPDLLATTNYTWLTNNTATVEVVTRTNVPTGVSLYSYGVKYDSLNLYRNPSSANFVRFRQGASGYDWRVGGVDNNLDFITSAGTVGTTAYAPGDTVMSLVGSSDITNNHVLAHGLRVSSNAPTWFSNNITAFYPAIIDPWYGNYIDFHRPNNTVPQYLRWYNDGWDEPTLVPSEAGRPSWLGIGTDVANASNSFWCIYDQVSGVDALSIGMSRSNRAHLGINAIPNPTVTLLITDPDLLATTNYTWLTNNTRTMEVVTRTNVPVGTAIYGYGQSYDGLDLYRNVGSANYLKFRQGVSGYDWRIGGVDNNLDFISSTGAVATTAYAPGETIVSVSPTNLWAKRLDGNGVGVTNIPLTGLQAVPVTNGQDNLLLGGVGFTNGTATGSYFEGTLLRKASGGSVLYTNTDSKSYIDISGSSVTFGTGEVGEKLEIYTDRISVDDSLSVGGTNEISNSGSKINNVGITNGIVTTGVNGVVLPATATPPALAQGGAQLWSDGTNLCVIIKDGGGALTTNKLTMSAWP